VDGNPAADVTPQQMRAVLGTFCSGIVVVTGSRPEPIGFTCQSFASLSLEPPLVSFAPARTSTTWPRIRELGRFCVNVLAHDQDDLSERFAVRGIDRFAGIESRSSPLGSPILAGVSAWIDCELAAEYDGGDHTIVLGAVRALDADTERHPLIFYRGRYAPSEHWAAWRPVIG
jgi:flavin reductase (DIM6/NTAB) family NADH-FMN oxidoreductase RutF